MLIGPGKGITGHTVVTAEREAGWGQPQEEPAMKLQNAKVRKNSGQQGKDSQDVASLEEPLRSIR